MPNPTGVPVPPSCLTLGSYGQALYHACFPAILYKTECATFSWYCPVILNEGGYLNDWAMKPMRTVAVAQAIQFRSGIQTESAYCY